MNASQAKHEDNRRTNVLRQGKCRTHNGNNKSGEDTATLPSIFNFGKETGSVVKSITKSSTNLEHHSKHFWFEDGNLLLMTEDMLFLVHQSVLGRVSPKLRKGIGKSRSQTQVNRTMNIIEMHVPGNGKTWEVILSSVYPFGFNEEQWRLSKQEWVVLYDIARAYELKGVQRLAANEVIKFTESSIDRIKLGRKEFDKPPDWCVEGYKELCERDRPLAIEEGLELGMEDVIKIAESREKLYHGKTWEMVSKCLTW